MSDGVELDARESLEEQKIYSQEKTKEGAAGQIRTLLNPL